MKKFLFLIFLIMLISFANAASVDKKIENELNNNTEVRVIISFYDNSLGSKAINYKTKENVIKKLSNQDFKKIYDLKDTNEIVAKLNKNSFYDLENDPNVKSIRLDQKVRITLQNSISLINATIVQSKVINGNNITGKDQTICVLDTGINYTHSELGGCSQNSFLNGTCNKIIRGWDYVNNDNNSYDDNGHGTHVSGIVAASGNITGVAPDASIVPIKVLDNNGNGFLSDVTNGINWCLGNQTNFNISVISMSLGTGVNYMTYCDDVEPALTQAINNAVGKNITIISATGNDNNDTAITLPACIKNVTSITSSTKQDTISSFSNRNSITDLIAPGTNINSTNWGPGLSGCLSNGNYLVCSGTSMATPHVAGIVALLQQYKKQVSNRTLTQIEVEHALKFSDKKIEDSNGLFYTRVNANKAVLSLDLPQVYLDYPEDNAKLNNLSINFNCSVKSEINLSNVSLYINSTGNFILNQTTNISGKNNVTKLNLTLNEGSYNWNCLAYDISGNSSFAPDNFTFTVDTTAPSINLSHPVNNSINETSFDIDFYFNVTDLHIIQNCSLNINSLVNKTINESITKNSLINITTNLQPSTYNYSLACTDNFNNIGNSETRNFSTLGDITKPVISSVSFGSIDSSSATITWTTDEISNSTVNYGTSSSNLNLVSASSSLVKSHSITLSSLSASTTHYYNVTSCDNYNNCNSSSQQSFTTSAADSGSSGGSGGSGGGGGGSSSGNSDGNNENGNLVNEVPVELASANEIVKLPNAEENNETKNITQVIENVKGKELRENLFTKLLNIISGKTTFTGEIIENKNERIPYRVGSIALLAFLVFIFYRIFLRKN